MKTTATTHRAFFAGFGRRGLLLVAALLSAAAPAAAILPEADAIFYGLVHIDSSPAEAGEEISFRLSAEEGGEELAAYVMGADSDAHELMYYIVRVPLEQATQAGEPRTPGFGRLGLRVGAFVRDTPVAAAFLAEPGIARRLDLGVTTDSGTGEVEVPDEDGDGVPDFFDNCGDEANPQQVDSDGDGVGEACKALAPELRFVGDVENPDDPDSGYGGVDYAYEMTATEVTNAEYVAFLNAVAAVDPNHLYSDAMLSDPRGGITRVSTQGNFHYQVKPNAGNKPVNFVSWPDAARYVNWVENGQPSGLQDATTTEQGSYDLSQEMPWLVSTRQSGSSWALPDEDEWMKAAFFSPLSLDYSDYPTCSETPPDVATSNNVGEVDNEGADVATHASGAHWNGVSGHVTGVNGAGPLSESCYGTADQGGNAWEWLGSPPENEVRVVRGGGYASPVAELASDAGFANRSLLLRDPTVGHVDVGFRVARVANLADDADQDGIVDSSDNCVDSFNPAQADTDGNGLGDVCNDHEDADGDEFSDAIDNCAAVPNPAQSDTDGDGLGDSCNDHEDVDGDEYSDTLDNCPVYSNPSQGDGDSDGFGDFCDNCRATPNDQTDANGDGVGDACTLDVLASLDGIGHVSDVIAEDGTAYLAVGDLVRIVDVSDPEAPASIATIDLGGGAITDLVLGNDHLFVGQGGQFFVYDVSNPAAPVFRTSRSAGGLAMALAGTRLYVVSEHQHHQIFLYDVSNPANPLSIGYLVESPWVFTALAAEGNQVAALDRNRGVSLVDWSAPSNPHLHSELDLAGSEESVALADGLVHVAAGEGGLRVLATDPLAEQGALPLALPATVLDVALGTPMAYLAAGPGGLAVAYFADPADLRPAGSFLLGEDVLAVEFDPPSELVFAALGDGGLAILVPNFDADADTQFDHLDNCPLVYNPNQADSDDDGTGDACGDLDGDGHIDPEDNCPTLANSDQLDTDDDGQGDVCDEDDDGDGLLDTVESNTGFFIDASDTGTDPLLADTDGDGEEDGAEVESGTDPLDPGRYPLALSFVTVDDPGNPADATGYGSVDGVYSIGKTEVTVREYVSFLNAIADTEDAHGLYSESGHVLYGVTRGGAQGSFTYAAVAGREQTPINFVSVFDAMRFANWLQNGQPEGPQDATTTEDGAYTLTEEGIAANLVPMNEAALYVLPGESGWYKAAYYDPGTQAYRAYPAASDATTACAAPGASANTANCEGVLGDLAAVGSYTASASPSGSFDQGGNVWEWTGTPVGASHRIRGGGFDGPAGELAAAESGLDADPLAESANLGFRLAMPEPEGPWSLWAGVGLLAALASRRREFSRRPVSHRARRRCLGSSQLDSNPVSTATVPS